MEGGSGKAIFKIDFHCDGCTEKICRCIKGFKGVEGVKVERDSNRLTVVGSMDPEKLGERLHKKINKKVELICPKMEKKNQNCCMTEPKKETQKCHKEKQVLIFSTIVLKIDLHCEGCISRIHHTISKIDGVEQVIIDRKKSQVTVQGTMKTKGLSEFLSHKIRKPVKLVSEKTNSHNYDTCHAGMAVHKYQYSPCNADVAVYTCEYPTCHADLAFYKCEYPKCHADVAFRKCEYYPTCHDDVAFYKCEYKPSDVAVCKFWCHACHDDVALLAVDRCGHRYRVDRVYASQIFSDENPNACCVM